MKMLALGFFSVAGVGILACGTLTAAPVSIIPDLPSGHTDTISVQLDPADGVVSGMAGSSVGWGFNVNWSSTTGDWISFTGSSLGSLTSPETNPSILGAYTDFIGSQGGPFDSSLAASPGTWTEALNNAASQGIGVYQIADSGTAVPGAQDTGQITVDFQVYDGDPFTGGTQIGDSSYSYYGPSTVFSVTVDAAAPEPSTFVLLLLITTALAILKFLRVRGSRFATVHPA